MRPPVLLHVALLREGLVAEVAGEGFEAAMDAEMGIEVGSLREALAAQLTAVLEFLVICAVHLHVGLEVSRRLEELAAKAALKLLFI